MLNWFLHPQLRIWGVFCMMVGAILLSAVHSNASTVTLPDHVLSNDAVFKWKYGPGSISSREDIAGPGVKFNLTGLSLADGTIISDDYPVSDIGQILPSHGNGDFSNFDAYGLTFTNSGSSAIEVSLIMNTGFTGPSGNPSNDWTNDTFWQSAWMEILGGQTATLRLDFDYAIPYGIEDNKLPHTQGTNGVLTAINAWDRTEVSNIGFQILGDGDAEILVQQPIPEPTTLLLTGSGLLGLLAFAFRRRRKETE